MRQRRANRGTSSTSSEPRLEPQSLLSLLDLGVVFESVLTSLFKEGKRIKGRYLKYSQHLKKIKNIVS